MFPSVALTTQTDSLIHRRGHGEDHSCCLVITRTKSDRGQCAHTYGTQPHTSQRFLCTGHDLRRLRGGSGSCGSVTGARGSHPTIARGDGSWLLSVVGLYRYIVGGSESAFFPSASAQISRSASGRISSRNMPYSSPFCPADGPCILYPWVSPSHASLSFTNALKTGRMRAILFAFFSIPVHSIIRTLRCHASSPSRRSQCSQCRIPAARRIRPRCPTSAAPPCR
mmetsp:Transcript_50778/g.134283  ORF Transcript_50778/g.134283 Transcript_50778/m.134283 type:complete len:225 (-) Transcript_50778:426-1100(-)